MKFGLAFKILALLMGVVVITAGSLILLSNNVTQRDVTQMGSEQLAGYLALGRHIIELAYPGPWQVVDGSMYKGSQLINGEFSVVDKIKEMTGNTATVFLGDTRIDTNVKDAAGNRAIGTKVAAEVAEAVLKQGKTYIGQAAVAGTMSYTAYEPIKDANGQIIGIWYVGTPLAEFVALAVNARKVMIYAGIGVLIAAAIIGVIFSRGILRPVNELSKVMESAENGDLTVDATVRGNDEIANLARGFNKMLSNLKTLINEIKGSAAEISEASIGLRESSGQTERSLEEISRAMQQVADGSKDQAASSDQTMFAVADLGKVIGQVASGASGQTASVQTVSDMTLDTSRFLGDMLNGLGRTKSSAAENAESARRGSEAVKKAALGMEEIRQVTGDIEKRVDELDARSRQIGSIIEVISGIAGETNLLSLNAAIEAARAGEHGRGFAVVAEQVRKLADDSARQAKSIGELVSSISDTMRQTVTVAATGANEVGKGMVLVSEAEAALNEINGSASATAGLVAELEATARELRNSSSKVEHSVDDIARVAQSNAAATEEMAANSESLVKLMESTAAISQENAASVEEVTASIDEISNSMKRMSSSGDTLANMAKKLSLVVAAFKV